MTVLSSLLFSYIEPMLRRRARELAMIRGGGSAASPSAAQPESMQMIMPTVKDFESAVRTWEDKVRRLEKEFGEKMSSSMKMGILTALSPASVHIFLYM